MCCLQCVLLGTQLQVRRHSLDRQQRHKFGRKLIRVDKATVGRIGGFRIAHGRVRLSGEFFFHNGATVSLHRL